MKDDAKELDEWLDAAAPKVQRNVKIVTPEDVGQDYFLHISIDTRLRVFTPYISQSQSRMEDRTVPRVTVAPTLLGCMIGYSRAETDFTDLEPGKSQKQSGESYQGGWKIYALPFKVALKPTARLVYDSRMSDEHWLVSYNAKTATYTPETAGKAFYHVITLVGRNGKMPEAFGELYVEVIKPEGIRFSKKIFLKKGYWKISGPAAKHAYSSNDDEDFEVEELIKGEYIAVKNQTAALLGITDPVPAYQSW